MFYGEEYNTFYFQLIKIWSQLFESWIVPTAR